MSEDYRRQNLEQELAGVRREAAILSTEVEVLRRRLDDSPHRSRALEERLRETKDQLAQSVARNEKLTYTLREARDSIATLREEIDKLTQAPASYGTFLGLNDDDGSADVFANGRKVRVAVNPELDELLEVGQELSLIHI